MQHMENLNRSLATELANYGEFYERLIRTVKYSLWIGDPEKQNLDVLIKSFEDLMVELKASHKETGS